MSDHKNLSLVAGSLKVLFGGIRWVGTHPLRALFGLVMIIVFLYFFFAVMRTASGQEIVASAVDSDFDGFSDAEELQYGTDPSNPYDFFDVPPKDGRVSFNDILLVIQRFGLQVGDPNYYVGFDRSANFGPPDVSIAFSDILMVVSQFGRVCTEVEWCGVQILELPDEGEVFEGAVKGEVCFAVRDENDNIVDYLILEDESVKEVVGEVPTAVSVLEANALVVTTPTVRFWYCEKKKTWKDFFRIPLYSIKLRVDFTELRNAGVYTGLVNVYDTSGTQGAWWPWNIDGTEPTRKTYVYTESGPWDFDIRVQKDVGLRANIAGHNIVFKSMHMRWRVGPGVSCYWWAWVD